MRVLFLMHPALVDGPEGQPAMQDVPHVRFDEMHSSPDVVLRPVVDADKAAFPEAWAGFAAEYGLEAPAAPAPEATPEKKHTRSKR